MKSELENLVVKIQEAGQEWIDAKLKADQLEEDQKSFLASLMNEIDKSYKPGTLVPVDGKGGIRTIQPEKPTESKLDRQARGSREYREYITSMCLARAEMLRKKVRYDALQSLFEAQRSTLALEREKIAKGIFHEGRG